MLLLQNRCISLVLVGAALIMIGCVPTKQARVAAVALTMRDVGQAAAKQSDLAIIVEGTPAYLMLIDGLIEAYPKDRQLLAAGCEAYSSYAAARGLGQDQQEVRNLYARAKDFGFRALSNEADFQQAAVGNVQEFEKLLQRLNKKDVPVLFCTASSWASWISANLSSVEALADLPVLEAAMRRVLELDDTYNYGSPHLLMGTYLASKPAVLGGDLEKARGHFERAISLSQDKFLMAKVLYAEYYARGVRDRDLYVTTLEEVLAASPDAVAELTLMNTVAKKKAAMLLEKTEEYFVKLP